MHVVMSLEENKAKIRLIHDEVINKGNMSIIDELVSVNIVDHGIPLEVPNGVDGMKQMVTTFRTAFPDINLTREDMIAEGDKVVCRYTMRGTHKGELMGIAPTGKQVTLSGIEINRFEQGKLVEHWEQADMMGLMQQIGSSPS